MANSIKCTCTENQINHVGCDCEASRQFDVPRLPVAVRAAREARFQEVVAAARVDYERNEDNSARYAASSSEFYAYVNEAAWLVAGEEGDPDDDYGDYDDGTPYDGEDE